MRVYFVFTKLLVWFLVTIILSHQEDEYNCPQSLDGDVLWPETKPSTCARSTPLCINKNMEIWPRCCDAEKKWQVPPQCDYFQETVRSPCPDYYKTNLIENTCIFALKDSTYPPTCPYEETLPFFKYIHDIDPAWLPVWMPVFRNTGKYELDLLRWVEPTLTYKSVYTECIEDVCDNYHFSEPLKDKNCVIFHNTSYVEAASCDEKHTAICAYQSLPYRVKSFCSQTFPPPNVCMQSDYSTRSKCFCEGSMDLASSRVRAEFLQPYQNLLYPALSSEMCYIGLERHLDGTYIWSNSNAPINYTSWARDALFGEKYKYGVISPNGWMLVPTEAESKCILYQEDLPQQNSDMTLEYDDQIKRFTVTVTNPRAWVSFENGSAPMVFCFTDAANDELISTMEVAITSVFVNYTTYSFDPHQDGPGNYWCEAFLYPDVVARSSNKYLLRYTESYTEEYAVILKTYYAKGSNPLTETNMKLFRDRLVNQIALSPIPSFIVRIFKIIDIDETNAEITLNFHVVNPASSEPLKLYSILRSYMEQNMEQFTFINVFGVDSCVGIQTSDSANTATWPITNIHEVAVKPREGYCVRIDGSIMTRRCYGDYIDGARWSELTEPCNIQPSTNITVNLTNIIALNNPKEYVEQVAEVAGVYASLTPLDVHLISKFLEQLADSDDIDIYTVVRIIDQLMNVSDEVLREAQIEFNATDRILYYTDKLVINSKFIGELTEQNFFLISYYIKVSNLSGVVLKSYSDVYFTIYKLFNSFDLDEIKAIDNLSVGVVLSQELMDHIYLTHDYDPRIIVIAYKNSKFFNEEMITKNAGMIMGVLLPDLGEEFSGEIFTVYNNSNISSDFNCSYWNYDLGVEKGSWKIDAQRVDGESAVFCTYDRLSHLALVRKMGINITHQLESILSSSNGLTDKLANASALVTKYYSEFQPIDVMLLSSLLYQATQTRDDNLDLIADIVNKVIDIPYDVLERSQMMYNATGKILTYFDEILKQFSSSTMIQRGNFYAAVQFLNQEVVYGFTMANCASKCDLKLLLEEPDESKILLIEDLDTGLIISRDLLDQLFNVSDKEYVPKMVITVFLDDTLFIEDYSTSRITTRVVGVLLPNFDEQFNGDIKVLYDVNMNVTSNYSCSVYCNDSNDTTYEKGFWNSENPPARMDSFLRCQFWKPNYFGLVYKLLNLTSILEKMLQSELPMEAVLEEVDSIASNYYNYLQAIDIFLIAQLFSKVTEVSDVALESCLNIVSNIMKISRHTLISSQELYGATNLILYHSNKVAQNYNKDKAMYKDNVILIVSLLSESSVFGIALENCQKQCQITVLYENATDYGNIDSIIDFDTELNISQNLIEQLLYYGEDTYVPKIVLTVYYNDALFNEQKGVKKTGKIFGVYLPNFHRVLSHEIKLSSNISVGRAAKGYDCALWEFHKDEAGTLRGKWVYQSQARGAERLACNFYQQSYFTFVEGVTVYENITTTLINISNSTTTSFSEKLYKTEDVSYYYSEFQPVDVSLLPDILSQCDQLADDGLDRLGVIINNILNIPSATLVESQNQYNALNQILDNIISIATFLKSHEQSNITGQFALVVCPINSTKTNSAVATTDSLRCTSNFEESDLTDIQNAVVVTVLSDDLLNQAMAGQANPKFIVTLFLNDIFFSSNDAINTDVVLGVSIPNLTTTLDGDVIAFFNSSSHKSNYYCAYREYQNFWAIGEPTARTGVYTRCDFQIATYYYLSFVEDSTNITETLKEIEEGSSKPSEKLKETLYIIMLYVPYFEAIDVFYVAQILSHVDHVDLADLQLVANITNLIMKITRGILVESQVKYNATDWILYQVDRILEVFDDTAEIVLENVALIITSNITGISIDDCDSSCNVKVLRENLSLMSVGNAKIFNTAIILDEEIQKQLNSTSRIFATIYFTSALYNEGYNGTYSNIGQIIGINIPSLDQDIQIPLKLYYHTESSNTDICVFWNYNVEEDHIEKGFWQRDKTPSQASGVYICEWTHTAHFALLVDDKNVTNDLENILNSNLPTKKKLIKVLSITLEVPDKLLPVDIYLIAEILNYAIENVGSDEMNLTAHIISLLFHIPRDVLRESQLKYYATDKILHSIDEMAKLLDRLDGDFIVYEHFVVAVYDLKGTNTSGLMLEYCESTMCQISVLENSVNLTQLGDNEHLETAMALSDELLEQVRQSALEAKLVVTIFFSDVLFNEESSRNRKTSMICGVLLPGFEDSLAGNVYLMFNAASRSGHSSSCAYWNYKVQEHESIVKGSWKTEDYPRSEQRFRICEFDHVTHFALLLSNDNSSYIDANTFYILDIITAVNCLLSLVGVLGILLTAALFERWRRNTGNQILLNFAIAISIKIVMLYVSVGVNEHHARGVMCSVTGAILHYAMLSEFCWMLIIAILQFKRFVEVLGGPPKYVLLKACVCGWVFPTLPVMLILVIDTDNYSEGKVGLCYPSGLGLYLGIWLPIIIIVAINFVIFFFIIYNVFHKKTETRDLVNHEILFQWRLALLLFSMLGLTWLFGFVSQIPGAYVFVYLFCFTATLQGFVMFLFFIVFNQSTRFLYAQAIKLWLYSRGYKVQ